MKRSPAAAAAVLAAAAFVAPCQEPASSSDQPPSRLEMRTLEARVNPNLEITLPTGHVSEEFNEDFDGLHLRFRMTYGFIANRIAAGAWKPALRFDRFRIWRSCRPSSWRTCSGAA